MEPAKSAVSKPPSTSSSLPQKVPEKLILLWHELKPWQQDNHYIRSGYRAPSASFTKSWKSLFYLHNETVSKYLPPLFI
jgi:adiponectin receptor